jgi:hypothetical protein
VSLDCGKLDFIALANLHWDGAFHTYQRFFTHLATVLDTGISDTLLSFKT